MDRLLGRIVRFSSKPDTTGRLHRQIILQGALRSLAGAVDCESEFYFGEYSEPFPLVSLVSAIPEKRQVVPSNEQEQKLEVRNYYLSHGTKIQLGKNSYKKL